MTWATEAVETLLGMAMLAAGLVVLVGYAAFKHDQRAEEIEAMEDEEDFERAAHRRLPKERNASSGRGRIISTSGGTSWAHSSLGFSLAGRSSTTISNTRSPRSKPMLGATSSTGGASQRRIQSIGSSNRRASAMQANVASNGIQNGASSLKRWWESHGVVAQNVRYVKVTPDLAMDWVTRNTHNRRLTDETIRIYERQINDGLWIFNGETIIFDANGTLMDGQHRLMAIINSGKSVFCLVVFDVSPDAFSTIDIGKKRRSDQVLDLANVQNSKIVSSAIGYLWRRDLKIDMGSRAPTTPEVTDYLSKHPEIVESAEICKPLIKTTGYVASMTAMHFLAAKIDKTTADGIIRALDTGAGLEDGKPLLTFRQTMVRFRSRREKPRGVIVMAMAIKLWNAVRTNNSPKYFGWRESEPFPTLVTGKSDQ